MLKKLFVFTILALSLSAHACWNASGTLGVDGETFKFDQKFDHDKDYSLPMGNFILNMMIKKGKKDQLLKYSVFEKKGATQTLITKGEEEISLKAEKEIYAKGEPGQPHSIITIKLKDI